MTLVIAGYEFNRSSTSFEWAAPRTETGEMDAKESEARPTGLFIAADSAITSGKQILLSGFRKVYPVTVSIWKPYFIGEAFRDYLQVNSTHQILIAFAGSTLTAQHFLNSITYHLDRLRITLDDPKSGSVAYTITTHCDRANCMYTPNLYFEEDIFTPAEMADFKPTAKQIAHAIHHSIRHALRSAAKYKIDAQGFRTLKTPFVAGIQCPTSLEYKIFRFDIFEKPDCSPLEMDVYQTLIPEDQVTVLGMSGRFDKRAQAEFTSARASGADTGGTMFNFVNIAIDEVRQQGGSEIDRPSVIRRLRNGSITTLRRLDDSDSADDLQIID